MALELSLRWGAGDPRWFYRLSREEQTDVLALARVQAAK